MFVSETIDCKGNILSLIIVFYCSVHVRHGLPDLQHAQQLGLLGLSQALGHGDPEFDAWALGREINKLLNVCLSFPRFLGCILVMFSLFMGFSSMFFSLWSWAQLMRDLGGTNFWTCSRILFSQVSQKFMHNFIKDAWTCSAYCLGGIFRLEITNFWKCSVKLILTGTV